MINKTNVISTINTLDDKRVVKRGISAYGNTAEYEVVIVKSNTLYGIKENSDIIHYFAPDTLEWEEMEFTYSQFVRWLVEGDTDTFYKSFRWQGWEQEVAELDFSEGISFYPFLWAQAEQRSRKPVPLREIITLAFDMRDQLGEAQTSFN